MNSDVYIYWASWGVPTQPASQILGTKKAREYLGLFFVAPC